MKVTPDRFLRLRLTDDRRSFALIVKHGRALLRWTLREAADVFHSCPGTISRWENGISAPPMMARKAIREEMQTRIRRLLIRVTVAGHPDIPPKIDPPSLPLFPAAVLDPHKNGKTKA